MECPVCAHAPLDAGAETCPNCNSDLTTFHLLGKVRRQRNSLRNWRMALIAIILIFFMSFAMSIISHDNAKDAHAAAVEENSNLAESSSSKITDLNKALVLKDSLIADLQLQIEEFKSSTVDIEVFMDDDGDTHTVHIVKPGETLWEISEKYHGHGWAHNDIADHNEVIDPHVINVGDTVIVTHKK